MPLQSAAVQRGSAQAPAAVVLVRPHHFLPNPETRIDNAFQRPVPRAWFDDVSSRAYDEVTGLAAALESAGVTVHLFDDLDRSRPDSVFPNNWFSTHPDGRVGVFPMFAPNRRHERRQDVIDLLKTRYRVRTVVDYSGLEPDGVALEGTGAMVLDHECRVAYAARSSRSDPEALERFCADFGYQPMAFEAVDDVGVPIYHTNIMLSVATDFALLGTELIPRAARRQQVRDRLTAGGRTVVDLTLAQIREFAGNAIELQGSAGRVLALSRRALHVLTGPQRAAIERSCTLLPIDVPTIELAGGSVRCMIAGVHLDPRDGTWRDDLAPVRSTESQVA